MHWANIHLRAQRIFIQRPLRTKFNLRLVLRVPATGEGQLAPRRTSVASQWQHRAWAVHLHPLINAEHEDKQTISLWTRVELGAGRALDKRKDHKSSVSPGKRT